MLGNATYLDVAKPSSLIQLLNSNSAAPQVAPVPQVNAPQYGNPAAGIKFLEPLTNLSIDTLVLLVIILVKQDKELKMYLLITLLLEMLWV